MPKTGCEQIQQVDLVLDIEIRGRVRGEGIADRLREEHGRERLRAQRDDCHRDPLAQREVAQLAADAADHRQEAERDEQRFGKDDLARGELARERGPEVRVRRPHRRGDGHRQSAHATDQCPESRSHAQINRIDFGGKQHGSSERTGKLHSKTIPTQRAHSHTPET